MKSGLLIRDTFSDEGTFGILRLEDLVFQTGELPWKGNKPKISCIPEGIYTCQWDYSPKFGWCYHVRNVPNRSDILIHPANWMGDKSKGYKSDVLGCIGLGNQRGILESQAAILDSKNSITTFNGRLSGSSLSLEIASKK